MALMLQAPWRTVRGRLLMAALLVEVLMLGLLVGNSLRLLREAMGEQARVQAAQIGPILSAALVAPLAQYDYATVQAVLDESHAIRGIDYIAVQDTAGTVVAVSGWVAGRALPPADETFNLDETPPRYDVQRSIVQSGQRLGTLRFGLDLSRIVHARDNLLQQGLAIASGELLLSAALLGLLGLLITRQLSLLTEASRRVAAGEFTLEPVPEGPDDVGRLGAAFNAMSRAISDRVEQLTRAHGQTASMAASLHERTLQLDAVFELSPDGFVSLGPDGTVAFASPAFLRMSGLSEAEVLGVDDATFSRRLAAVCASDAAFPGLDTLRAQWLAAGDGRPPRQLIRLAGGAQRVLEVGLRESVGGEVQRLLFFRDVTHETEVDRMKSEFLSHAAHELRTPMASIYGFAELLRTRRMSDEKRQELLDIIHRQAEAMTAIIDELLDLARIDDRRGKDFVFAPVDAAGLLRAAVAGFKPPEGREAPLLDLPEGLPPLRADASKLEQAMRNLLSNAYKYSPGGGAVEVRLLDGGDGRLGLQVRDHGLGMSPEQVARVFERFYRADTSGNIPGTGLGMSIVQEIASLHQGEAVVDSALGEGTTVTLWLPTVAAWRG